MPQTVLFNILFLLLRIIDVPRHVSRVNFGVLSRRSRKREEGDFIYADNAGCIAVG